MFICGRGRCKRVWLCVRMKVRVCVGYLSREKLIRSQGSVTFLTSHHIIQ